MPSLVFIGMSVMVRLGLTRRIDRFRTIVKGVDDNWVRYFKSCQLTDIVNDKHNRCRMCILKVLVDDVSRFLIFNNKSVLV